MDGILPTGKLPPGMLRRLIGAYARPVVSPQPGPSPHGGAAGGVVVGPGIGLDAAVLDADIPGGYLIAKTDPITFVADDIGPYAVAINANDIACMGGTPRWFLAAVILPEGKATESMAESIFSSMSLACEEIGVSIVGGHTEIAHSLDRPIVVGHMLGTVPRDGLITAAGAKAGDSVILTKGIAIEAVSVIARIRGEELAREYHEEFVERCRDFVKKPGVSVLKDAQVAIAAGGVHCLHDPTEGGLSTGLYEIAEASGVGIEVRAADIRVLPEAFELLRRFGLDPLGSIASGALLITAAKEDAGRIISALKDAGINAYDIGNVTDKSKGVKLIKSSGPVDLPVFERDEITKIFITPPAPLLS